MDAVLPEIGKGVWSLISGTGELADTNNVRTRVTELSVGRNEFQWTVTNGACPPVSDNMVINVNDLIIPTLITPNMDGKNDYFVLRGIENLGKTELIVFDRRGLKVYETKNYQNDWEGLDYNGNPLPDDTYFYVLKTTNGKSLSGFVVVRR
jgi:gliding motility-associated-like protein